MRGFRGSSKGWCSGRVFRLAGAALLLVSIASGCGDASPRTLDPTTDEFRERGAELFQANEFSGLLDLAEAGLRHDPENADALRFRMMALGYLGDREALAVCDRLQERSPEDEGLETERATILVALGDYDAAAGQIAVLTIRSMRHILRVETHPVTAEDLQFGAEQLRTMLEDRPTMAESLAEVPGLADWAIRCFAGELLGSRIYWSDELPPYGDAVHTIPREGHAATIHLHPGRGRYFGRSTVATFEDLWSSAAFEFFNVCNAAKFKDVHERATRGELDRVAYVAEHVMAEYGAQLRLRQFYGELFLKWAAAGGFQSKPSHWRVHLPSDGWEYLSRHVAAAPDEYPEIPWGHFYDEWFQQRYENRQRATDHSPTGNDRK